MKQCLPSAAAIFAGPGVHPAAGTGAPGLSALLHSIGTDVAEQTLSPPIHLSYNIAANIAYIRLYSPILAYIRLYSPILAYIRL